MGFPGGSVVKNLPANAGDSIPGLGRHPGEGNDNPLQYFCLRNPMDRETWQAIVHRVAKESDMTWQLNNIHMYINTYMNILYTFIYMNIYVYIVYIHIYEYIHV